VPPNNPSMTDFKSLLAQVAQGRSLGETEASGRSTSS
jgi:hypothetical protein